MFSKGFSREPRKTIIKGPKVVWVSKDKIIPLKYILNVSKETPIMVPRQWLLMLHDGRKVYIPKPKTKERRKSNLWRKLAQPGDLWWLVKCEHFFVYQ